MISSAMRKAGSVLSVRGTGLSDGTGRRLPGSGGGNARFAFNVAVAVLGLLALLAISPVGHVIAVVAAITVIGIPIAIAVAALPAIFLLVLAVRLATGVWDGVRGGRSLVALAFAVALLVMVDFFVFHAWRVNAWHDGRATAFVAGDKDQLGSPARIDTLGVLRNTRSARDTENSCDDLCRRLLLTGAVKQVLLLTAAPDAPPPRKSGRGRREAGYRMPEWPALEPVAEMSGTAWRLERRDRCADPGPLSQRQVRLPTPARRPRGLAARSIGSDELMRLIIAGGTCLVGEDKSLAAADALLAYGHLHSGVSLFGAGYDAGADTLSVWRIAFWRRTEAGLTEQYRRTSAAWQRFPGLLVPTIIGGAELRTSNSWMRAAAQLNAAKYEREPQIAAFVTSRLGLALELAMPVGGGETTAEVAPQEQLFSGQASAVDRILAAVEPPSENDTKVVADYLGALGSSFARRDNGADADDARRVERILADRRIALPSRAITAVQFAVQRAPETAPGIAEALLARLDALPPTMPSGADRAAVNAQMSAITGSLAELPAEVVRPYRTQAVALMRDRERRTSATRLLGRLDLFGPAIVPDVFAMMDDAAALRETRTRELRHLSSRWGDIWRAGMQSICRMAPQIPDALPELRSRLHSLATQRVHLANEVVIAAMLRMGATEDDVRETLDIDPLDQRAARSFASTLRRARRDGACR